MYKRQEQRKTLRSADISGDGKSVVYYAMMASDDEMALMDALAGQNADMGEVTRVLMEMKDEARKEENKRSTVDILSGSSLTDGQKAEIFRSTGSDSLEEKLSVAEEYGISGGEWMEAEEGFAQELSLIHISWPWRPSSRRPGGTQARTANGGSRSTIPAWSTAAGET